ncbi:hypothetical protein DSCA_06600 [Desulfosarcina alkanivorans]|uniref:Methyltransferase FkbM domain-containing protein n=1 Tax=Desulfosarcina alkanivorans TaxID=571177 RepID=A0A5K7YFC5_9BACT|nr:FkbM family methyltransferase [Desulfosarcina alkanivorans]BBO66730.1 hypothetical protein DSCA_06600 [Desulfosarcina alkanivorans]
MGKFLNTIHDIQENANLAIFGAGSAGIEFKEYLHQKRKDVSVSFFIDSYKHGVVDDIEVVNPRMIKTYQEEYNCSLIIIASCFSQEIEKILKDLGIENYRIANATLLELDDILPMFPFESDRELLLSCFAGYLNRDAQVFESYYQNKESGHNLKQYEEFIDFSQINTAIDAGTHWGYHLKKFSKRMPPGSRLFGFEPDWQIIKGGPHWEYLQSQQNISLFPLALWSKPEKLDIYVDPEHMGRSICQSSSEKPTNAEMASWKRISIDATSVDAFAQERNIEGLDFIKMDIEGAEMQALKGAQETIDRYRPSMAVCIYHKLSDFYDIPKFIHQFGGYHFRIGHYHPEFAETVLYAIPERHKTI